MPRFHTAFKMRWDDTFLYFGGYVQEPQIWANMTEHGTCLQLRKLNTCTLISLCDLCTDADSVVFQDNDFEVFVDPDGSTHHYKVLNASVAKVRFAEC